MAYSKTRGLSFDEKREKYFSPILFHELSLLSPKDPKVSPINIKYCNASEPCCFSDAFIDFICPSDSYQFEVWFKNFYLDLVNKTMGNKKMGTEDKKLLESFIDAVIDDQHLRCLQKLLTDDIKEAELTVLLALHYFKPLVYDCSVFIDSKSQCKSCGGDAIYADTSLGSKKVWHGRADILLHRSAVTVCLEKDLAEMSLSSSIEEESDDLGCGDQSEMNVSLSHLNEERSEKNMTKNSTYQAISEGITNAFCQAKKNKDLFNKFIPSFLVTQKYVTIILYNCELDMLLLSEQYPIWESESEKLDLSTILRIWITMNYFEELDQTIGKRFLQPWLPSSGFKRLVGEAYDTYLNEVQMPLDQKCKGVEKDDLKYKKLSSAVFNANDIVFRTDALAEITKTCQSMYSQTQ